MNCKQLYEMGGDSKDWIDGTLTDFFEYDEITDKDGIYNIEEELTKRVTVKDVINYCFDGRRVWVLKTLWFDNEPFAVMQEAGREGDDHRDRYISNVETFKKCIDFINSLLQPKLEEIDGLVDENEDMPSLTNFYGHDIEEFIKDGYSPKYKVGDEVEIELSGYYKWTKPLAEKGMLTQKATIVRQKECNADDILVELYEFVQPKNSYGYQNVTHVSEVKGSAEEYKRLTVWVDDDLEHSYR